MEPFIFILRRESFSSRAHCTFASSQKGKRNNFKQLFPSSMKFEINNNDSLLVNYIYKLFFLYETCFTAQLLKFNFIQFNLAYFIIVQFWFESYNFTLTLYSNKSKACSKLTNNNHIAVVRYCLKWRSLGGNLASITSGRCETNIVKYNLSIGRVVQLFEIHWNTIKNIMSSCFVGKPKLTSTLIPLWLKTWAGGWSRGTYL